jgi:hypothetical protein
MRVLRHLWSAVGILKETFHLGDFESVAHPFIHAREGEGVSLLLMTDVGADKSAHTSGVNVGDVREIEHQAGGAGAHPILKLEEGPDGKRALEPENALLILKTCVFDDEGFVSHKQAIVSRGCGKSMGTHEF